jgi:hypothetical protein
VSEAASRIEDARRLPGRFRAGGELVANQAWIHALGEPLAA